MNPKISPIILLASCIFVSQIVLADNGANDNECDQTPKVRFKTNDIFDLDDPDTIFVHYWANFFHIKTKDITLGNESAFFIRKCDITQADIDELERHFRKQ
jgi:hypothetical protein